jgi:DNA-binding transcriptional regulator of glucitol operon
MAVGFGKNAKWVFKTDAAKDSIFNFYRDEDNSIDWELINEKSDVLIFRRGKRMKMVIGLNQERSSNTLRFTQTLFTD